MMAGDSLRERKKRPVNHKTKECHVIINDKVESRKVPLNCIITDKDGLKYYNDNYGMGAIWWPIIEKVSDAYERHLIENVKWAKDRLPWARKNSPDEVSMLSNIIKHNGKGRDRDIWANKIKEYADGKKKVHKRLD